MASNTGCMSAGAGNWSGRSNSASVDWMRKPRPSPQSPDEVATERDRAGAREGPFAAVELRFLSKVNSGHPGADFHLAATGSQLVPFRPRMRDGHGWPEVAETIGPAGALARMMRKVRVGRRRENEWQPRSYNP